MPLFAAPCVKTLVLDDLDEVIQVIEILHAALCQRSVNRTLRINYRGWWTLYQESILHSIGRLPKNTVPRSFQ